MATARQGAPGRPRANVKGADAEKVKPDIDPAAAEDAVAEVQDEETEGDGKKIVEYLGKEYTFDPGMIESPQWRRLWSRGRDVAAIEMLLGVTQFEKLMDDTMDEAKGYTPQAVWDDFITAVGKANNAPNS